MYVLDECPHPFIIGWPSLVREGFKLYAREGQAQFSDKPRFPFVTPMDVRATQAPPLALVNEARRKPRTRRGKHKQRRQKSQVESEESKAPEETEEPMQRTPRKAAKKIAKSMPPAGASSQMDNQSPETMPPQTLGAKRKVTSVGTPEGKGIDEVNKWWCEMLQRVVSSTTKLWDDQKEKKKLKSVASSATTKTTADGEPIPKSVRFHSRVDTTEGPETLADEQKTELKETRLAEGTEPTDNRAATKRKRRNRRKKTELQKKRKQAGPGSAKTSEQKGTDGQRFCKRTGGVLPTSGAATVETLFLIPPMSEANVPTHFVGDDRLDKKSQYLFEPTPLGQMKDKQWRAAACLVQRRKSGRLFTRIMNPTNVELVLYAGTPLGTWEHLSQKQIMAITLLEKPSTRRRTTAKVASARGQDHEESRQEEEEKPDYATEEDLRAKVEGGQNELSKAQQEQLFKLLWKFRYMFRNTPGRTDLVQHVIDTGQHRPIRGSRYRQSESDRQRIREIVQEMLDAGVVRPSKSPWGASVVLVPKKCGATRFCVDYRRLNEITAKDVYPLPRIDATLDQLGGSRFFTALDLTSGFWQVGMSDEDAAKTAFMTPDGLYEFTAMPFGLCNAPATFQRLMDQVLGDLRYEYALVYLDDVMIHSATFEDHLVHIESVLSCLQKASLACKLKKCFFAQPSTVYLGHVVSAKGIEPEPAKLEAVKELVPPTDKKGIRMFLGFVGYYRKFIENFSAVAKPLNSLLRKDAEWKWGVEQQDAWEDLRTALVTAPILQMPDYTKRFTIRTDASYNGLGACLLQGEGDGRHPIAYASRSLKPAETRYTATEIECLGVKWAVGVFRPYVHGRRFTLETDHIAIKWLRTVQHNNARLIRTALELQQYDMEIVHRPGIQMYDADALSRLRRENSQDVRDEIEAVVASAKDFTVYYGQGDPGVEVEVEVEAEVEADGQQGPCETTVQLLDMEEQLARRHGDTSTPMRLGKVAALLGQEADEEPTPAPESLLARVAEERSRDPYFSKLYKYLCGDKEDDDTLTTRMRNDLQRFVVRGGHLYRIEQLYRGGRAQAGKVRYLLWVPEPLRPDVLFACHDHLMSGGHLGVSKTFARLRKRYYWPGMFRSVEEWCKTCAACASRKDPSGVLAPLNPLPVPTEPFEMVSVDVCGPFVDAEGSGNRHVVVYCDHLTRWVETVPIRRNDSNVIARVLVERIMCRHGAPKVILSDRGHPFMSAIAREVYRLLRVKKVSTAAYRPQTNGLVERFNRTLANMLSMYVNSRHTDWDRYLPFVTFAYNTTPHAGTGESPFFLLYGREARLPIDSMLLPSLDDGATTLDDYRKELVEGLRVAHQYSREALLRSKQRMEQRRGPGQRVPTFEKGDLVLVKNPALHTAVGLTRKLTNTWTGPFQIMDKIATNTYRVSGGASPEGRAVHIGRLKAYHAGDHPEADDEDYANYFETAGEALPTEGARTYAPTEEEKELPPGDGEHNAPDATYQQDEVHAGQTQPATTQLLQPPPLPPMQPVAPTTAPALPSTSAEELTALPTPELGLLTPVLPSGRRRVICKLCHKPKKNHKCAGRYVPTRQLSAARERLGLANPDQRAIFGIVCVTPNGREVFGAYAQNDVRTMPVVQDRLVSWEAEAKKMGRTDNEIWNDMCAVCDQQGHLYMCYGCNLAYHPRCSVRPVLNRRLRENEDFLCPDCLRDCVDLNATLPALPAPADAHANQQVAAVRQE